MAEGDTVHMFWHGGALPPLAQACVASFAARGHRVVVHSYASVALPGGIARADARAVIDTADPLHRLCAPRSIAAFADCFRYRLLHRLGGWWMDTDVWCLTAALPDAPRAWAEQEPGVVNNAILRFPAGDPLIGRLAELAERRAQDGLRWGAIGPDLVTEVLGAAPREGAVGSQPEFYPLHWREAHWLWLPERRADVEARTRGALFLHCWARALENAGVDPWWRAPAGSRLAHMLRGTRAARAAPPWREVWVRERLRRGVAGGDAFEPGSAGRALRWARRSVVLPLRAARLGLKLPPGRLDDVQGRIDADRTFFLDRARRHGPVFRVLVHGQYTTCVVGHARGARLIAAHEPRLSGFTVDLTGLFPIGALRGMSGETHRRYRRQFLHALQAAPLEAHAEVAAGLMRDALEAIAAAPGAVGGEDLRARLRSLSTAVLMRILYGIEPGSAEARALAAEYLQLGPSAPVPRIEAPHARAFAAIENRLRARADTARRAEGGGMPPCALAHLARSGEADATTMGNLAYLLEAGHYDLYSLWHWMLRMLAAHPQAQAGYAARTDRVAREAWARAIVLETLRLEQSELLYWRVAEDIAFEGWLLPRGTVLRICIWEGHKDDATFPEPFRFAPERFIGTRHGLDAFAPFGLGSRRCLGADLVVGLSAMLVRTLLDRWHLERVADGPPLKGPYHWQPGRAFAVRLLRAAQPSR